MVGSMMFFLWMISIGISLAQDESDETIEKAKQAYKYGEQLFKEGNYPEAIKAFERAYGMTNRYQLLFNLALSHQFSADLEQARYYFEEYQRLAPAEQWNEALLALEPVAAIDSKFTSTDRSKMYYYRGYIYFSKEQYGMTETAY